MKNVNYTGEFGAVCFGKLLLYHNHIPSMVAWYIYLHLVEFCSNCKEIYHTWMPLVETYQTTILSNTEQLTVFFRYLLGLHSYPTSEEGVRLDV